MMRANYRIPHPIRHAGARLEWLNSIRGKDAMLTEIRLHGEIEGPIWMPSEVCTKEFDVELVRIPRDAKTRVAHSHGWPMEISTLRDALLTITNDGDFQNASITYAVLTVTHRKGNKSVSRTWELRGKGENSDCFSA